MVPSRNAARVSSEVPGVQGNRLSSKLALATGATLLSFVLLELSFRIHLFGLEAFSFDAVNSFVPLGHAGVVKASDHPEILFDLKPNLDTHFKSATFSTNSAGLRDREYKIAKLDNVFRVAVLGDSFSMPVGVEIEDAYHSILEARFNAGSADDKFEFINFAVGGYTLRQYAGVLKHKALEYEPDLILIGWCSGNDHRVPPDQRFRRPYVPKPKVNAFFRSFLLNRQYSQRVFFGVIGYRTAEMYSDAQTDYVRKHFDHIRTLAGDVPVVVAYLASQYNRTHVEQVRGLEGLATDAGFHFANPSDLDTFGEDNFEKYRLNTIDTHPNAAAHAVFADRLHDVLKELMTSAAAGDVSPNRSREPTSQ